MQTILARRPLSQSVLAGALNEGYTPLQAQIIAGRLQDKEAADLRQRISPRLSALSSPRHLPDIEIATERLARVVIDHEVLACATDYDCDGVSAQCVIQHAFLNVFHHAASRFRPFIGLRMRDGYGMSDNLVERILEQAPDTNVVCTADQGSSDQARLAILQQHRIDTIVTDHHGVPESGPPAAAIACVNPVRVDSQFEDKCIAGVHVAFLTMCAVRERLIDLGALDKDTPSLAHLADLVALGVVADAVSFARSINNRAITRYGLSLMNGRNPRPCWQAARQLLKKSDSFVASDVAFFLGPLINAAGRLSDAMTGVRFLMSSSVDEAWEYLSQLDAANKERREIEAQMRAKAIPIAQKEAAAGRSAVVVFLEDGHSGIHGVVCSKVVEAVGRPAVCFSRKPGDSEMITGSLRSIEGVHIRECLAEVDQLNPGLLTGFGGHAGAAGAHLKLANLARFTDAFDASVRSRVQGRALVPSIKVDGELRGAPSLEHVADLMALAPYGREFDAPIFTMVATVVQAVPVGDGTHLRMSVRDDAGAVHAAIWFRAVGSDGVIPVMLGDRKIFAFELGANTFRNTTTVQLKIVAAVEVTPGAPQ